MGSDVWWSSLEASGIPLDQEILLDSLQGCSLQLVVRSNRQGSPLPLASPLF
jgi:hypothetical protein